MASHQAAALPLKVIQTQDAYPNWVGAILDVGGKAYTGSNGYLSLEFPFKAGVNRLYPCTHADVWRSELVDGALKVTVLTSQRAFCFKQHFMTFSYRPFSNPYSEVILSSNGQYLRITGTNGAVTEDGEDAIFAITEGRAIAQSSNGDTALLPEGNLAVVNEEGITIRPIPPLNYDLEWLGEGSQARIVFAQGLGVSVNGQEIRSGQVVQNPKVITVRGVDGVERTDKVRRWPKFW
jgi:hypothetical protein